MFYRNKARANRYGLRGPCICIFPRAGVFWPLFPGSGGTFVPPDWLSYLTARTGYRDGQQSRQTGWPFSSRSMDSMVISPHTEHRRLVISRAGSGSGQAGSFTSNSSAGVRACIQAKLSSLLIPSGRGRSTSRTPFPVRPAVKPERLLAPRPEQQIPLSGAASQHHLDRVHAAGVVLADAHQLFVIRKPRRSAVPSRTAPP